jgi:Domain of unknown function (DUF4124)
LRGWKNRSKLKHMKILLAILFLFTLNSAQAELYKSIGEDGEVIYTDKPPTENAQEFKPPEIQVTPPVKIPPKKQPPVTQQVAPYPYSDIRFTQPEADANFFDNEGIIRYALSITPALNTKLGHYLNIKLDGTALASKTSSMSGELKEIERGSHSLSADICDASGKVLKSASVSFHLHKHSTLHNPPPTPSPPPAPAPR